MLKVYVLILDENGNSVAHYSMDHDDPVQRRRLGEGCRAVFEAGGTVVTSTNPRLVDDVADMTTCLERNMWTWSPNC